MFNPEQQSGDDDLSVANGPVKYSPEAYALNLRESLIRHLTEYIQDNLNGVDIGRAVLKITALKADGLDHCAKIFNDAQEEALKITGEVPIDDILSIGGHFGVYENTRLRERRLGEVDLLKKLTKE